MLRVNTFTVGEVLTAADMNSIEDTALGIAQVPGVMVGPTQFYCIDGTNLKVGPIAGLMTNTGNPNHNLATSSESTIATSSLTASTHYYVYAYNNSGAIAFEYNTTAPDATLTYKSTPDTTRRYIGTFRSDGASAVLPFQSVRGVYEYQCVRTTESTPGGRTGILSTSSPATTLTAVSAAAFVPPHVRLIKLELVCNNNDASNPAYFVVKSPDSGSTDHTNVLIAVQSSINFYQQALASVRCNSSNEVTYKVTNSSTRTVYLNVVGFTE